MRVCVCVCARGVCSDVSTSFWGVAQRKGNYHVTSWRKLCSLFQIKETPSRSQARHLANNWEDHLRPSLVLFRCRAQQQCVRYVVE